MITCHVGCCMLLYCGRFFAFNGHTTGADPESNLTGFQLTPIYYRLKHVMLLMWVQGHEGWCECYEIVKAPRDRRHDPLLTHH